jgi:hypothetical protein
MKTTSKIGSLVQSFAHPVKVGMAKAKARIFEGPSVFTIWSGARVLALGVLMAAAVAMYFNMTSEGEAGSPSSPDRAEVAPTITNEPASPVSGAELFTYLDDAWMYGPPFLDDFSDDEAAKPSSSEQGKAVRPLSNSRAIERLEEQISIMLFNAAQAGKPLSDKEIERLDAQMDMMLAAEARTRSGYRPFSSKQADCYPEVDEYTCTSDQIKASFEQQRAADSLEERLEVQRVHQDMQNYYGGVNRPSYDQQRAADSLEERLEVQRLRQNR